MDRISTTRLYASSIAIVSGLYSMLSSLDAAMGTPMMMDLNATLGIGGWSMLAVGVVVLVHGVILLTPAAAALRRTSGPLMIAWASIMLLNQWLLPARGMMDSSGGMVAIAILMLASGVIMTTRQAPGVEM